MEPSASGGWLMFPPLLLRSPRPSSWVLSRSSTGAAKVLPALCPPGMRPSSTSPCPCPTVQPLLPPRAPCCCVACMWCCRRMYALSSASSHGADSTDSGRYAYSTPAKASVAPPCTRNRTCHPAMPPSAPSMARRPAASGAAKICASAILASIALYANVMCVAG